MTAPSGLTGEEESIFTAKRKSSVSYEYAAEKELVFELKTRSSIAVAARNLNKSRAAFAVYRKSRCNEAFWNRTEDGGFRLKEGIAPAAAIRDIFENGKKYAFECAVAVVIVFYRGVLDTVGEERFNRLFSEIFLHDWHYDKDLQLMEIQHTEESFIGDSLYFKNPEVKPELPQWQGENVIKLGDDLYYGHGAGIKTKEEMIEKLNKLRKSGSKISAYLMDLAVFPDYVALYGTAENSPPAPSSGRWDLRRSSLYTARIGSRVYLGL